MAEIMQQLQLKAIRIVLLWRPRNSSCSCSLGLSRHHKWLHDAGQHAAEVVAR